MGLLNANFAAGMAPGLAEMGKQVASHGMRDQLDRNERAAQEAMEQRIAERTRGEKSADWEKQKAWDVEKGGLLHKNKLEEIEAGSRARIAERDPNEAKLNKLRVKEAEDALKMPEAVRMEYKALYEENKLLADKILTAQLSDTANPDAVKVAEAKIGKNTLRLLELSRKYQGEAAPKGKGVYDPSAYIKKEGQKIEPGKVGNIPLG